MKRTAKLPKRPEKPQPAFTLPPHVDDLFDWGGTLDRLRYADPDDPADPGMPILTVPGPLGSDRRAFDARWFEELCDADEPLQQLLAEVVKTGRYEQRLTEIQSHVERVFSEKLLQTVAEAFFADVSLITRYFAAREAYRDCQRKHPDVPAT